MLTAIAVSYLTRQRGGLRGHYRSRCHRAIAEQRFVADELVTVLLQDGAGERLPAQNVDGLAVLLELVHQRDEVAVAADDGERVHVIMREGHLQGVQRQIDVRAILIAAGRGNALDHLDGVFRHLARCALLAAPVCVGELGYQVAALFERI